MLGRRRGGLTRACRIASASVSIAAVAALAASPAAGSVTLGQLAPGVSPPGYLEGQCGGPVPGDYLQQTVISGNSYVVPGQGVITSWSHNAGDGSGQTLTFKVFRHFGGALFTAVGHSGPFPLIAGKINTFPASIPVSAGDIIGLRVPTATPGVACDADVPGEDGELTTAADLADGQSGAFAPSAPGYRVNISAVFEPDCDSDGLGDETQDPETALCKDRNFSFGKLKRNKKKGTATLTVELPGPGTLVLTGKGLIRQRPAAAPRASGVLAKTVSAAGRVNLKVKPKGKKKSKLYRAGKVTVTAKVTYKPTSGLPNTKAKRIKLVKQL
jgi:hypothetical protein